jgi:hypothetical protein
MLAALKRRLKRQEQVHAARIRNGLLARYFPEMDGDYEEKADCLGVMR